MSLTIPTLSGMRVDLLGKISELERSIAETTHPALDNHRLSMVSRKAAFSECLVMVEECLAANKDTGRRRNSDFLGLF